MRLSAGLQTGAVLSVAALDAERHVTVTLISSQPIARAATSAVMRGRILGPDPQHDFFVAVKVLPTALDSTRREV